MIRRWLCKHGWHSWELWVGSWTGMPRQICRWCGKVEHVA